MERGNVRVLSLIRRMVVAVVVLGTAALGVALASPASATTGDVGYQDQNYNGATYEPTSDKPQSKLWFAQDAWWADMFDAVSGTWHIFRLQRSSQTWVDTGVQIDERVNTLADVLWDGTHLYVASHVVTISNDGGSQAAIPDSPARLYRFSYSSSTSSYSLDTGFPVTITGESSESLTIDKDSTGALWATWTRVSGSSAAGFTSTVYANSTTGSDTSWGTPFVVPVSGSTVTPDDISTVVAFGHNRIGIMWSNELDGGVYWAVHRDGDPMDSWQGSPAVRGQRQADDHLNIKAVQADTSGRVYAVVKTSLDSSPTVSPTDPQIQLLSFKPATGAWTATTVSTVGDCQTRPQLLLDEASQRVHVFMTGPTSGGCPYPGAPGTIYAKSTAMDNPVFATGRGNPIIRDAASAGMNNVTSTKQSVTPASGIVLLASNEATKRYWHADLAVDGTPSPTASFTSSVSGGDAPLAVQFTDTSTGAPTSWAWDFGDGGTATTQNPAHTFDTAGTYAVSLTVRSAAGSSAPVTATVTVSPASTAGGGGQVIAGASSTAGSTTAVQQVSVPRAAGVVAGTVLIAQITADATPTMGGVPAGWSLVLAGPQTLGVNARVFAYVHVVADPAAEPDAYVWQLSAAQKWNAVLTAFSGVDTVNPFDTAASTSTNNSYSVASLTVPGVSTLTPGAMLVGGLGMDSSAAGVTPPAGWTESGEGSGGQTAELAYRSMPTAGASGSATWTQPRATASAGWLRALRPAAGTATPGPVAPTAAFTSSVTSGPAPLAVQFTDRSTGSPTTWSWTFGDGSSATMQNPAHTFTSAGTYTVALTAANGAGTSAPATATITVSAAPVAPTAAFTSSVTSGPAPLAVQFTDRSTGSPTTWSWTFGDGSSATMQNPAHTFTSAGTYTVALTAANGAGTSAPATATITVSAATPSSAGGIVVGASTTSGSATAVTGVTIPRPAGVVAGTLLVAQITGDAAPGMSTVPAGWTPVLAAPLNIGGNARVFAYWHVVSDPAAEPAEYGWQFSVAVKFNAGMTAFSGVDAANPFDTQASTAVGTNYTATSLTVPGVTTVTDGAMVIGGLGLDSKAISVTQPSGWNEAWESTGGQVAELASRAPAQAGATGAVTWSLSAGTTAAGWMRALRPAP